MERTLLILKPDSLDRQLVGKILAQVEAVGLRIRRMELIQLDAARAREFYQEHEGKPFLGDLVGYMTSGPCLPVMFEGENAVSRLREPLRPYQRRASSATFCVVRDCYSMVRLVARIETSFPKLHLKR